MHHLLILALALGLTTRNDAEGKEDALAAEVKGGIDTLKTERDTAQGELAALRADAKTPEVVETERLAWYNERQEIVEVAERYNVDAIETLGNDALRKAVALKAYPDVAQDGSSDFYSGMYATAATKRTDSKPGDKQGNRQWHVIESACYRKNA